MKPQPIHPPEHFLLKIMTEAYYGLIDIGWQMAATCPRDSVTREFLECGGTGIHRGHRDADGSFWLVGENDVWPSRPILWREVAAPAETGEVSGG